MRNIPPPRVTLPVEAAAPDRRGIPGGTVTTIEINPEKVEANAGAAFGYLAGAIVAGTIWLGDELGLYRRWPAPGRSPATSWPRRPA